MERLAYGLSPVARQAKGELEDNFEARYSCLAEIPAALYKKQ